jgi:twitching motility protein PilJ
MKLSFPIKRPRRRTITHRFAALFAVLVSGFAMLAVAFGFFVSMNSTAIDSNNRTTEFGFSVARIKSEILQARGAEKDFLTRREYKYLEKHAESMSSAYANIARAKNLAPSEESQTLLGVIDTHMKAYQEAFKKAAEAQRLVGYNENSGLHGRLRQTVHGVEELLGQQEKIELTASVLVMRQHENNFIQSKAPDYIGRMAKEHENFANALATSKLSADVQSTIFSKLKDYYRDFQALADGYTVLAKNIAVFRDAVQRTEPLLQRLAAETSRLLNENREAQAATTQLITWSFAGLLFAVSLVGSLMLLMTHRSITGPLNMLGRTIAELAAGNKEARAKLDTGDEMQEFGDALDRMMDESGQFMRTEEENEILNNSIMGILRAVSRLGSGDLTTEAPVNEDITGALGDAINQMSDGIAKTLAQVNNASAQVVAGSRHARDATAHSRETVLSTVRGMNEIRTTIQETAKRIKRLGERSQEISGIVKLIDTIAERTNVLALNANMQAAQAGEAGRGFMVVAAEVQRLAESAKEATDQIAKLISGIQVETGEAISTMDRSIEEVVEGSQLAEKGATEMNLTDEAVEALNALGAQLQEAVRAFKLPTGYVAQDGDTTAAVRAAAA